MILNSRGTQTHPKAGASRNSHTVKVFGTFPGKALATAMLTALCTLLLLAATSYGTVYALSSYVEVSVNGLQINSDVAGFIHEDRTYVPLRAIAEALGAEVSYEEDVQTAVIKTASSDIRMPVNSTTVTVNGQPMSIPAPSMVVNDRVMVPLRFVSEALDGYVVWSEAQELNGQVVNPNRASVYSPMGTKLASGIYISSLINDKNIYLEGDSEDSPSGYRNLAKPQFDGFSDTAFQQELNEELRSLMEDAEQEIVGFYQDSKEGNAEIDPVVELCDFTVISEDGGLVTVQINGHSYWGGSHGTPYLFTYMLDVNQNKRLTIKDVFQPGVDFESAIIREIYKLRASDAEDMELITEEIEEVEDDFCDFYFEDGNLIVYYPPYRLSWVIRWYVKFAIPVENIADILL